jgi:AcrR family transcriptional regulator
MSRPAKINEKRQELLDKAVTVFSRYGYSKTTLNDIAEKSGINKASLYHYFKNKEELFVQVMLQVSAAGIEELKQNALRFKNPEKQLIFYFSERLHFYLLIVGLNSLSKETLLHLQVIFDSVYQPVKEKEIEWIAALLKKTVVTLTKKQSVDYARQLFYVADAIKHNGVFTGHLLEKKDEEIAAVKQQITDTISLLLKGIQFKN